MIGQLIEHYLIGEILGQGGMGVVYRALDVNLERTVAVKVLSASLRDDPEFVERFRQEVRIQAGLNHPNIATLFDFFIWNDLPVAVMEFIQGETLRHRLDRSGPIPAHIALPIFIQALRGVAAGHKRGIIHRDLKPSNLMITDEGIVKVTDFGIAKVRSNTGLTQASTRVGSASYMAPEQILGRPVDVHTDIYIMGATLYELLSGHVAFRGTSQFEIDSAHVRDPPKPPTVYCPHIPPAAVDAIMRALAKDPAERFASAEEFIQALPDLRGVPFIAAEVAKATSSGTATGDETQLRPEITRSPTTASASPDETRLPQNASTTAHTTLAGNASLQSVRGRRVGPAAVVSGLFVALLVVGIVRYWPMHASVGSDRSVGSQQVLPERSQLVTPASASASAPNPTGSSDLTGTWTGTYLDSSGKTQLQLLNLQMRQVADGAITGRFTYKAATTAEECTLDKSSYSTQSKRLRLIVHCRNPNHPKYLNVPLDFTGVDPHASSIEGGRLAFHLDDDIVVTLERTRGV